MIGMILYTVSAFGLGCFLPGGRDGALSYAGIRFFSGAALISLALFFAHAIAGIDLRTTCFVILAIAVVGITIKIRRQNRQIIALETITHPIPVFTVGVLAFAAFQGGVGYIPYLSDEFSHWIGITRQIHTLGAFDIDAIAHGVPDYLVGWPLLMAYPGAILGTYDEGQIALLPTVLHIGMLAMVYDVVRAVLRADTKLSEKQIALFTWFGLLALLGIEASGQLVARNLLTEPPQVYGMTAIGVLCMAASRFPDHAQRLAGHAGIVLASLYIIKITALAMIPALALFAVWLSRRDVNSAAPAIANGTALVRLGLAYFGLMALALISWKYFGGPANTTEYSNPARLLTPSRLANLANADSAHIAKLWFAHLWDYVSTYKVPLTLAALVGVIWAGFDNRWRWVVIVLGLFLLVYMAAFLLYQVESWKLWFHSVQRFTRVGLRALHLSGLMLLGLMTLEALSRRSDGGFGAILVSRKIRTAALVGIIVLGAFQSFQGHQRIADLGTRAAQSTQEGTLTARAGALALRAHVAGYGGSKPNILMINASHDRYWLKMLFFNLLPSKFAAGFPDATIIDNRFSWYMPKARTVIPRQPPGWFPVPADINIIWPFSLNATDREKLLRITDSDCADDPAQYFLVRQHPEAATFSCPWKLPADIDGLPVPR